MNKYKYNIFNSKVKCVCCKEELKYYSYDEDDKTGQFYKQFWQGIVFEAHAGYGSIHDLDSYIGGICDECIKKCREDKSLLFLASGFGDNIYE